MKILEQISKCRLKKSYFIHEEIEEKDLIEKTKKENPGCLVIVEDVSDYVRIDIYDNKNWKVSLAKIQGEF